MINSLRGAPLGLLFLFSTEHRGLSRTLKTESKDGHNTVFANFFPLWVSLCFYLSTNLTFGIAILIWMLASLLGVNPLIPSFDQGTKRTVTGESATHAAVFGKKAEEFLPRRTLGEGSCAFWPLGRDPLSMSPAPSYSLKSRSPLGAAWTGEIGCRRNGFLGHCRLSLTIGVLVVLSEVSKLHK